MSDDIEAIKKKKDAWEKRIVKLSLEKLGLKKSSARFYSPCDLEDYDFEKKVGFPGEFPFTAGSYAVPLPGTAPSMGSGFQDTGKGLVRAGQYSGYGTPEDTRDYYRNMISMGQGSGPNLAFQLPTQCGYDSDHPKAHGEIGKTGVAVDTLRDMEVIYEAFTGERDLDKIASSWTINAPAGMILAMYIALAEQRGIPQDKLRGTLQNDILKEFSGRGTYIFPPRPSMRLTRDIMVYCNRHMPCLNFISCGTPHLRNAGCTRAQAIGFLLANASAYIQLGIDAGLDIDSFLPRFSFLGIGGSMEIFKEVAAIRAMRRMYARLIKEKFGAKNPRCMIMKTNAMARTNEAEYTIQRPLNNLPRSVLGGMAAVLSGGTPSSGMGFPYDEPLGLGHSIEAWQLHRDAARIIQFETSLCDTIDPLAGSYYIESLTDRIEKDANTIYNKIEMMGGAVAAIENGWMQRAIARSAYEYQKDVEGGKRVIVGVNRFVGKEELEVKISRLASHPYDPKRSEKAEKKQLTSLAKVKKERDNKQVEITLKNLKDAAKEQDVNLVPVIIEAVKAYATIGEMCDVLRDVFGEYEGYGVI